MLHPYSGAENRGSRSCPGVPFLVTTPEMAYTVFRYNRSSPFREQDSSGQHFVVRGYVVFGCTFIVSVLRSRRQAEEVTPARPERTAVGSTGCVSNMAAFASIDRWLAGNPGLLLCVCAMAVPSGCYQPAKPDRARRPPATAQQPAA